MLCTEDKFNEKGKGKKYAIKIVPNGFFKLKEVEILKLLHHPHAVKLHEVIEDPEAPRSYIIMENIEGRTLKAYLNKLRD